MNQLTEKIAAIADDEGMVSLDGLRNLCLDSGVAHEAEQVKRQLGLPPKPATPDGAPTGFMEAMFWKGPCAFPMFSRDKDRWVFFVALDGAPIRLPDGSFVKFDTYDEAISQVTGYANWVASGRA